MDKYGNRKIVANDDMVLNRMSEVNSKIKVQTFIFVQQPRENLDNREGKKYTCTRILFYLDLTKAFDVTLYIIIKGTLRESFIYEYIEVSKG